MATVVKRSSSSRLKSSSTSSTTATVTNSRRSTRASEAAAANTGDMSLTIEASAASRDARMLTPPPMSARSELALRLGEVSMNSPVSERRGSAAQNNAAASQNSAATPSHLAQNRALLLSGLPKGQDSPQSESSRASSPASGIQRRDSGNGSLVGNRRLTPLVTVTASGLPQNQNRRHLSAHPNLSSPIAQSPRTISPCVYVKAVGVRRPSAVDANVKGEDADTEKDSSDKKSKSSASSINSDSLLSTPPPESRLAVLARITPVNTDKQPFTLHREFDLQELVDVLPRPDHRRPSTVNILASPTVHGSMPFSFPSPSPTATKKRPASDTAPASPHPNVRRQTRQSSQQQQQPPQLTPVKELPSPSQFAANGRIPIPFCPHPSLGRIPGLAAIILSRRVEAGDTIEIPVPFPEAWPMTVAYVYDSTGNAEASSEVRANLEHLGGSVIEK